MTDFLVEDVEIGFFVDFSVSSTKADERGYNLKVCKGGERLGKRWAPKGWAFSQILPLLNVCFWKCDWVCCGDNCLLVGVEIHDFEAFSRGLRF